MSRRSSTPTPPRPRPSAKHTLPSRASHCTCTADRTFRYQHPRQTRFKGSQRTMAYSVTLPELGESVTEGTVTRWLKQEGDTVAVDEPLLEISTDKVDTEVPSPVAGAVQRIVAREDETVEVGGELAVIGDGSAGAAPAAAAPPAAA